MIEESRDLRHSNKNYYVNAQLIYFLSVYWRGARHYAMYRTGKFSDSVAQDTIGKSIMLVIASRDLRHTKRNYNMVNLFL